MSAEPTERSTPATHRRLRFGLRTAFIAVTLVCVCFGLFVGPKVRRRIYQSKWDALGVKINLDASCDGDVKELELFYRTSTIPPEFWNLPNLEVLDLSNTGRTKLPPEVCKLNKLRWLELERNHVSLPSDIGELTNLSFLGVGVNQLGSLPPEIGKLRNLKKLMLFHNQLTELPPEIGNLTELNYLHLRGNKLTALSPAIGNLSKLRVVELSDNQLTALPPEIGNLKNLKHLNLRGNRIHSEEIELLKRALPQCEILHD